MTFFVLNIFMILEQNVISTVKIVRYAMHRKAEGNFDRSEFMCKERMWSLHRGRVVIRK